MRHDHGPQEVIKERLSSLLVFGPGTLSAVPWNETFALNGDKVEPS